MDWAPKTTTNHGDGQYAALSLAIERLEAAWLPAYLAPGPDYFAYEALPAYEFVPLILAAREVAPGAQYLEVGCGIGTKLVIAAALGFEVHGIEARESYVAAARYLCPEATIEVADARGYDNYGAFDVVYCYRPLVSDDGEAALEDRLTQRMRAGALLMLPHRQVEGPLWESLGESLWKRT